jgi:hypothetical protein
VGAGRVEGADPLHDQVGFGCLIPLDPSRVAFLVWVLREDENDTFAFKRYVPHTRMLSPHGVTA